ncbi:MAG: single-stranded-DNA-specific exonuclease RecJ [Alphaproteobacteria bacterium]
MTAKTKFSEVSQTTPVVAPSTAAPSVALSVEKSVMGKKWVFADADQRLADGISQAFGLPEIVSRILVARGIGFDDVETFLNPTLKVQLPDPFTLKDMEKGATRIADAIIKGEKVCVFGDYDVDGATSSALLKRFFRAVGSDIRVYIPDRIGEGYGPNVEAMKLLAGEGHKVLITVDCGITSYEPLQAAADAGMDTVVLDHHRAEAKLPVAHALVNPNRLDCTSGLGQLAAVGVTFIAIVAINRILRAKGWYGDKKPEPRILHWLDIVALGTVADVVPLTGVNRAFVSQGLKVMAMRKNPGITALADIAGVSEQPTAFHAGFMIGPRVNAGGRVGEADLGWRILSTDDTLEARMVAHKLHQYNIERKHIEDNVLDDALNNVKDRNLHQDLVILADGDNWHAGVIGIVAARLKEKYNRPVCVIAFDTKEIGKASCRSVSGIDLGAAVVAAKQRGLLIAGGGHKMAAGFTVARHMMEELRIFLNKHVQDQLNGADYVPELKLDGVLSAPGITTDLVEKLEALAPYGSGHAEPRFAISGVKIIKPSVVGERHVSCFIQDTAGGSSLKGIAFRALDTALGETLLKAGTTPLNIAGHATINTWQGRKNVNFQIVDAAPVWK